MPIHFGVNFGVTECKKGQNSPDKHIMPYFAVLYFDMITSGQIRKILLELFTSRWQFQQLCCIVEIFDQIDFQACRKAGRP